MGKKKDMDMDSALKKCCDDIYRITQGADHMARMTNIIDLAESLLKDIAIDEKMGHADPDVGGHLRSALYEMNRARLGLARESLERERKAIRQLAAADHAKKKEERK